MPGPRGASQSEPMKIESPFVQRTAAPHLDSLDQSNALGAQRGAVRRVAGIRAQALRACASRFLCLCTVQCWTGTASQRRRWPCRAPAPRRTMRNSGRASPRRIRSSRTLRQGSALSPCSWSPAALFAHSRACQRDGRGLAVKPHAPHGAVEDQVHDGLLRQRAGVPGVPIVLNAG